MLCLSVIGIYEVIDTELECGTACCLSGHWGVEGELTGICFVSTGHQRVHAFVGLAIRGCCLYVMLGRGIVRVPKRESNYNLGKWLKRVLDCNAHFNCLSKSCN